MLVDGTQVGTINPGNANYALFPIPFSTQAGGHTITFQGTTSGNSTVLIDSVAFKTAAAPHGSGQPQQTRPVTVEFLAQPSSGSARSRLAPVLVEVFNRSGSLGSGLQVRLILIRVGKRSRGHFVLGSVVHAKTKHGVATFQSLRISAPGRYVLRAKVGRHHADSAPFDISPRKPH